jgi:hypothetical protein
VTVSRPAQLSLFLSLTLALGQLPMRGQEPLAPAAAAASEPTAAPEKAPKPAPEPEKMPKRAKADDDDDRPARTPRKTAAAPLPTPVPASAAATPKPGFFKRVFGSKKKPTPAPVAASTPKPKPKVKKDDDDEKPKPKKDDEETKPKKPSATTDTPPKTDSGEPPDIAGKTPKAASTPRATPRGKGKSPVKEPTKGGEPGAKKEQQALDHAIKGGDAEAIEQARYDYAHARAVEDEHVRDLKAKADNATSEEEGRKGLRAYNRALFDAMRKLEPAVSERANRMESAVLKRLGGADD